MQISVSIISSFSDPGWQENEIIPTVIKEKRALQNRKKLLMVN